MDKIRDNLSWAWLWLVQSLRRSTRKQGEVIEVNMTKTALDWIFSRRSIRKYHPMAVEVEKVDLILKAAMAAPSANNSKPWHFVVMQDRSRLDEIATTHPYAKMVYEAPLVIAVCGEVKLSKKYWVQDCSAATQNILLAARTLGLGSVWLGVHPRLKRKESLKELLRIPEGVEILSMVAIGYGAEEKEARTQYDPSRVRQEEW